MGKLILTVGIILIIKNKTNYFLPSPVLQKRNVMQKNIIEKPLLFSHALCFTKVRNQKLGYPVCVISRRWLIISGNEIKYFPGDWRLIDSFS